MTLFCVRDFVKGMEGKKVNVGISVLDEARSTWNIPILLLAWNRSADSNTIRMQDPKEHWSWGMANDGLDSDGCRHEH